MFQRSLAESKSCKENIVVLAKRHSKRWCVVQEKAGRLCHISSLGGIKTLSRRHIKIVRILLELVYLNPNPVLNVPYAMTPNA